MRTPRSTQEPSGGAARMAFALLAIAVEGGALAATPAGYDFAAYATGSGCGAITLSGSDSTNSFDSSQGSYSQTEQLAKSPLGTSGNATLSGSVTINGPIFALNTTVGSCRNGTPGITVSGTAKATGGYLQLSAAPAFPNPGAVSSGSQNYTVTSNTTLAPGSYGNITVSGAATLTFSPGTYGINSLTLNGASTLAVNPAGPVIVNLAGKSVSQAIEVAGTARLNPSGTPLHMQLIYGGSLPFVMSGSVAAYAVLYAPNAPLTISGTADWYGALVVNTLTSSGAVALHYDRSLAIAPTITEAVTPAPTAAGWNNSSVTVSFTCSDAIVGIASCTAPVTLSAQGANQIVTGTGVNRAGFSANASATVSIDKTPPTISGIATPARNSRGWNNTNVTVTFTCADSLSGIATCPASTVITSEGANQVVAGTAVDKAGNTAMASVTISLDKTPPNVTLSSPANGATVSLPSVTVNGSAADALSGIASVTCQGTPAPMAGSSFSCTVPIVQGTNVITVVATDIAGNLATVSTTVTGSGPSITTLAPSSGSQGQTLAGVAITGQFTHFTQATPTITFSNPGVTASAVSVTDNTHLTATLTIASAAATGASNVTVVTGSEVATGTSLFMVTGGTSVISQINPSSGQQGQSNLPLTITGQFTHFSASSVVTFSGTGITAGAPTSVTLTSLTVPVAIGANAPVGPQGIQVVTGSETDSLANAFTVTAGTPTITQVNPSTGQQGQTLSGVVITGAFTHFTQGSPMVTFSNAGVVASAVAVTDNTHLTATLTIAATASAGASNVTVVTGAETAAGTSLFTVSRGTSVVTQLSPTSGQQGQSNLSLTITGAFTHFSASSVVTFSGTGITAGAPTLVTLTSLTVPVTIGANAPVGPQGIQVVTGSETDSLANAFTVTAGTPIITQVNPNSGPQGQTLASVAVTGQFTHFAQGTTVANFGTGITVNSTTVTDATDATVSLTIASNATVGARAVAITTGAEAATLTNGFSVTAAIGPTITDFNPKSAPVGTVITVTGTDLQPNTGTSAQFTLAKQGGGTVTGFATTASATSVTFVVPAGAVTGIPSVTVNNQNASGAVALTIVPSSTFSVSAAPSAGNLIQGQSVGFSVSLTSASGFDTLAALSVAGVPSGVTAAFMPQSITAGQTSILTLTAPGNQPVATSALTITASASVNGLPVTQTANVSVSVMAPTTSFLGRTVVSDSLQTPLAGVTITMLGKDGNGETTGCTGGTVSDGGGNFLLTNLPPTCVGPQLVGFNGTTVTSPPGSYAGVNLVFTFVAGQVTASPVLVHLPRIDDVETFLVTQNSPVNQTHAFTSIPGLSVTVYAGTTFTLQDGTQPNPFPLAAVQVPVDRLPDAKPQVPTMMRVFIVAFQPANATTNEPVAVYFPNTINTPPGTDMALMTLDPTHGQMVPYGTGAVSSDGTQIVPDPDPAHPGHLYGLIHFDWHGPMPPPPAQSNPGPPGGGGGSGIGPGGGYGPGGGPPPAGPCSADGDNSASGYGQGGTGSCVLPTPPPPSYGTCPANAENLAPNFKSAGELAQTGSPAEAGDPVDLFSGIMTISNTDISISGSLGSIAIVRTYRSLTTNPGPFGIGTGFNYGYQIGTAAFVGGGGPITLVMPDGNQFPFNPQPGGVLTNTTIPALIGAVMTSPASEVYNLRWKDGTVYQFQSSSVGGLIAFLTSITDANGNVTSVTLNPSVPGQVTQITDPVGRSLTLSYDGSGRVTSITDPTGRSVQYGYNSQGTLATVTDPVGGITQYAYDSNNNMLQVTDPRGIIQAQNTLDSQGRVIQQVRPDGGTLTFSYTMLNPLASTSQMMLAQVTDSQGVQATYRFNPLGFVTDVTATQGQVRDMPRAAGTNLLTSVTESSSTQSYTYDASGNVLSSTDATGFTTQFTYEPIFNKVTSITDPLGNVTRFTYDGKGNLLTSTDANGNVSSYQYNSMGLLTQSTDALNQKTTFTYDGFGNRVSATDPTGSTTSFNYDGLSRMVQTKDAQGRPTSFTYDPLDRLLTRTDAKSGVTQFTYDPDGNLLSVKDARNNTTTFTYDVMNRLATRTDPLGHSDSRTYDTNGNLVTFVDRRGQTRAFTYDNLNRRIGESYSDATVSRSYDDLGRLVQVTDSAAGVFGFTYDAAGRLTGSSTPVGTTNYTYDGRGLMASRQVAGEPALSYTYDAAGNLASAALPQASANFVYDARNQLSNISRANGVSSSFGYDPDARLLAITHAAANTIDAETYTYDAVGNRVGHSTSIGQSLITQPTANQYNVNNQLTLFGSVSNSYDANGNLFQEGSSTSYIWDGRNRLRSIMTAAGQTTNFTYDFAGNMMAQADSGTSLNLTKTFVLDSLTNVAYEAASDGTSYSVLSGQSIDSHLAIAQSTGQVQYGLTDAINTTVATTDQSGAIKSQFLYDPFGQTTTTSSFPFQFTGRMPVSTTTYYYRARFYNTQTGRFISEDPIGFSGGNVNLYAYVRNNPVRRVDPFGLTDILTGPLQPSQDTQNPPSNPSGCSVAGNFVQCMVTEELKGQPISKAADLAVGMCPFAETPFTAAVCITGFLYKTTEIPQTLIEAGQCYQEAQSQCAGCAYMQNFKWKLPQ